MNIYLGTYFKVPLYLSVWLPLFWGIMSYFVPNPPAVLSMVFVTYFIVVLHEYGHVLFGKMANIQTSRIELDLLGGAAYMEHNFEKANPYKELLVVIGGPLVNLVLVGLSILAYSFLPEGSSIKVFSTFFGFINLILLLFNLIPIFPMDGGRILRSTISIFFGEKVGKKISVYSSLFFAVISIALFVWFKMFAAAIIIGFMASYSLEKVISKQLD